MTTLSQDMFIAGAQNRLEAPVNSSPISEASEIERDCWKMCSERVWGGDRLVGHSMVYWRIRLRVSRNVKTRWGFTSAGYSGTSLCGV